MKGRNVGWSRLSRDEHAALFERGTVTTYARGKPPYTIRLKDTLTLSGDRLRKPSTFGQALRDYVASIVLPAWDASPHWSGTEKELADIVRGCEETLHRSRHLHNVTLTCNAVRSRITGLMAERLTAGWIRDMLGRISTHARQTVTLEQWSGFTDLIDLGGGYMVRPLDATNFIVLEKNGNRHHSIGEFDMMLMSTKDDEAMVTDVSTSSIAMERKLNLKEEPEQDFMHFRRRMQELFKHSGGAEGFRRVSKLHILCGGGKSGVSALIRDNGLDAVLKVQLPVYHIIHQVSDEILKHLYGSGVLTVEEGDVCALRNGRTSKSGHQ